MRVKLKTAKAEIYEENEIRIGQKPPENSIKNYYMVLYSMLVVFSSEIEHAVNCARISNTEEVDCGSNVNTTVHF